MNARAAPAACKIVRLLEVSEGAEPHVALTTRTLLHLPALNVHEWVFWKFNVVCMLPVALSIGDRRSWDQMKLW